MGLLSDSGKCWSGCLFAGECSQSELAQRMQIEAPTLVGVLDRMERDGWIERVPDADDRRKKRICPTGKVQPVWEKMVECARLVRSEAIQGISEADLHKVRDVLGKVRENLTGETAAERQMQPRMEPTT